MGDVPASPAGEGNFGEKQDQQKRENPISECVEILECFHLPCLAEFRDFAASA
jgi:hypothetical protein